MEKIAINVRNSVIRSNFNTKLYYQLSALSEQCQRGVLTEKETREEIPILKREKDLSLTNLRKIRKEIRKKLTEMISLNVDYYTDYTLAKLIYAVSCISYDNEGFKGLDTNNSKILFSIRYINLIERAVETPKDFKKEIENLILLDG